MALRVVGAGVGRTGTQSLKLALERLLGAPCYHMLDVAERPKDIAVWRSALEGESVNWDGVFDDFVACVDWPAAAFWRELSASYPDAIVLLSTRDAESWFRSMNSTIVAVLRRTPTPDMREWRAMWDDLMRLRFTNRISDASLAMRAYERHNALVREHVDPERLVEWRLGEGWEPLCRALGIPVPQEPFPHVNTTQGFRLMTRLADMNRNASD